jgi:GNAT superfamily N-acetyltransferase
MTVESSERLVRVPAGPERDASLPLLFLADGSMSQVHACYQRGDLFALRGDDGVRGVTLVLYEPDGGAELKAVAVAPELYGRGVGRRMIALVLAALRTASVRRVTVGTGNCAIGPIAFYQKCGFRLWRIERDFFTMARGYEAGAEEHGIPLRDMVWMDREL